MPRKQRKVDSGLRWGEGSTQKRITQGGEERWVARWPEGEGPDKVWRGKTFATEDEAEITTHLLWQLPLQGDGWYDVGSVDDHHAGTIGAMRVLWHIESDRVRVKRTLALARPTVAPYRPIRVDGNYHVTVDEGWRYWLGDVAYTPDQVRQIVGYRDGVRSVDWRWERIKD